MPEYISNIVVNRWKNDEKDKKNYTLLTMSPTGIERFDQHGKRQFEGKLEPRECYHMTILIIIADILNLLMTSFV